MAVDQSFVYNLTGYNHEELLGKSIALLFPSSKDTEFLEQEGERRGETWTRLVQQRCLKCYL